MPTFNYKAFEINGKMKSGVIEADTIKLARTSLKDKGLFVSELIESDKTRTNRSFLHLYQRKLSLSEIGLMLRQLSTLIQAGLPLEQALLVLTEQSESKSLCAVIASIRADVLAGNTLARAMMKHQQVFPSIHCALIHAGEESGQLAIVMDKLATYSEEQQTLKQKIVLAMIYPVIVILVSIAVVGGLLVFVVPPVIEVFQQSHQALPLLTKMLIGLSIIAVDGWPYILATLVAIGFAAKVFLQNQQSLFQLQLRLLSVPILGKLIRGSNTARMTSTLSILVGSGVALIPALNSCCGVVSNLPMRKALVDAISNVEQGVSLSRALSVSGLFPPVLIHLIASGEKSGQLDSMLDRVAHQQTNEVSGFTSALTSVLEPILIVVMGSVVLIIVLAILMPIIQMNQLVK